MSKVRSFMACMLALFLTGCSLARAEWQQGNSTPDRLIGVFVTLQWLEIKEGSANLNRPEGKLYAQIIEQEDSNAGGVYRDVVFPGVEGIRYFAYETQDVTANMADIGVSDSRIHIMDMDAGKKLEMEATLYYCWEERPEEELITFYLNPVYQEADGAIYTVAGSGMSGNLVDGAEFSQKLEESHHFKLNGEEWMWETAAEIHMEGMARPTKVKLQFMGEDGQILSTAEYDPDDLPESTAPGKDVAYIIAECTGMNMQGEPSVERRLYDREEEWIEAFRAQDNGLCVNDSIQILWNEEGEV